MEIPANNFPTPADVLPLLLVAELEGGPQIGGGTYALKTSNR